MSTASLVTKAAESTGGVFLDVAKAFNTILIENLIYKLIRFVSYLVKLITNLTIRAYVAAFQSTNTSRHLMKAGVAHGGLISPMLFRL